MNLTNNKYLFKQSLSISNTGKRHSEYLSRIQARFENFQGPAINLHSSRLFLQTDAIRMTPNLWNNTYTLFLFDHQLIYCKKDLLKRTNYLYKGRIFLDNCRILNLPDGKIFGVTLKNALRIYCDTRIKWFDFCFRSATSKIRFLNTLAAERQFCGQHLFVSELAGVEDDISGGGDDREYGTGTASIDYSSDSMQQMGGSVMGHHHQYDLDAAETRERGIDVENINIVNVREPMVVESQENKYKKSDTLPKKSRKFQKDPQQCVTNNNNNNSIYEFQSNSLGRKKIGRWFRKAKSSNTTPSQSPTHHPMVLSVAATASESSLVAADKTTSS